MNKIISSERLRRALAHLAPNQPKYCSEEERSVRTTRLAKSTSWMDKAVGESTQESLCIPWIFDADTTVKLLYGRQAGAEIGCSPTKPGWPSILCTPTGSETSVWCSMSRYNAVKPMRRNIVYHDCVS